METDAVIETPVPVVQPSLARFWKLWSANSFSNLGDGLYQIVLPLIAVRVTSSPVLVSGLSVMLSLPWLIFALQAGSIVDRLDRRRVMQWVTGGRLIILTGLTLALINGWASMPLLYAAALLLGIGETLVDTALTSIVPSIVPRDRLTWANARITAAQTVTNAFIGPPLAGYLAAIGFALATGSSALLYALAGSALLFMGGAYRAVPEAGGQGDTQWWAHLTEGIRFVWKTPLIRKLTLFTASMNLFWSGFGAVLVLYAVKPGPMGLGEFEYGLLLTAMAVGGLVGSALCEQIQRRFGTRNALALDMVGTVLLVGVPAVTPNPVAVGAAAFAAGLGASVWVILVASIRQQIVPEGLLGRVYSASRFISWGIGPLGAVLAGVVSEVWGIRTMFAAGAVLSTTLMVVFLIMMSERALVQESPHLPAPR